MSKLRERHEVVAEADGRTFVFLAEPEEGRLTIREVDPEGEEELCGLTLADPEELEVFFAGLHRVLRTAGVARGERLGAGATEPAPRLGAGSPPDQRPAARADRGAGAETEEDRRQMVEKARRRNARAFTAWTPEEEREVVERYRAGESTEAIARSRGRSRRAIEMRLEKLGVTR